MKNVSTEWSYREGLEWGEIWAGMDAGSYAELVEWSKPDCLGRMPIEDFARNYIEEVTEEAEKQGRIST